MVLLLALDCKSGAEKIANDQTEFRGHDFMFVFFEFAACYSECVWQLETIRLYAHALVHAGRSVCVNQCRQECSW